MTARRRRAARGMTLLEVMVAAVVLLVAMIGFLVTTRYAVSANAMGHRRTMTTFLRGELVDRLAVTPRAALAPLATFTGTGSPAFVVDGCFDVDGKPLSRNGGWGNTAYACDAGTIYRSWVGAKDAGNSTWNVSVYVERLDVTGAGCNASQRYASDACSPADLLLTD